MMMVMVVRMMVVMLMIVMVVVMSKTACQKQHVETMTTPGIMIAIARCRFHHGQTNRGKSRGIQGQQASSNHKIDAERTRDSIVED